MTDIQQKERFKMSNLTFKSVREGDTVLVTAIVNSVIVQTFPLPRENAEALANSIREALDNGSDEPDFAEGDRVIFDGSDGLVFANAGAVGTVTNPAMLDEFVEVDFADVGKQIVLPSALALADEDAPETDEDDPDMGMLRDLRQSVNGLRVTVVGDEPYGVTRDGSHDPVNFPEGTEGTILPWDEFEAEFGESGHDENKNFPVRTDEGLVQVVALDCTLPVDRETVYARSREVGARWAERRGIVVGATVSLPPTSLLAVVFGQGTVVSINDGMAEVRVEGADAVEDFPLTSLRAV